MISRFFRKKPKPQPKPAPKAAPKRAAPKKSSVKKTPPAPTPVKVKAPIAPAPAPLSLKSHGEEASFVEPIPPLKPGKIITAEGWKRIMMRRSGPKLKH